MSERGKKRTKSWYRKQDFCNKRNKMDQKQGHRLTAGLKGFIVTCSDREREAVKESYNILNEYADKLHGPETKAEARAEDSEDSDVDDVEAAIAKEVQELKTPQSERRFQNSRTGTKNCIFIKTTLDDPVGLAHAIFTDLRQSKLQKSRSALRLLPVVGTCKANVKDINDLAKVVLEPFFTDTKLEVTFDITFKARNNNGVGRDMIISTLRQTIMDTFSSVLLKFTHFNPHITILVEVMCGVACIAVAKDFAAFRKYNLVEVVHDRSAECGPGAESENTARIQDDDDEDVDEPGSQLEEADEVSCEQSDSVSEKKSEIVVTETGETSQTEKSNQATELIMAETKDRSLASQLIIGETEHLSQAEQVNVEESENGRQEHQAEQVNVEESENGIQEHQAEQVNVEESKNGIQEQMEQIAQATEVAKKATEQVIQVREFMESSSSTEETQAHELLMEAVGSGNQAIELEKAAFEKREQAIELMRAEGEETSESSGLINAAAADISQINQLVETVYGNAHQAYTLLTAEAEESSQV